MPSPRIIFRHLFVLLICQTVVTIASPVSALRPDTSTIVVVGTVHNATKYYDVQTLCRIIDRVKPDLLLVELDSSFFTPSMSLKSEFTSISMENKAISVALQSRPIPVRPYDIEGRNQIYEQHNYFKLQRDLSSALNAAERDSLLGSKAAFLLDAIIRFDDIGAGFGSERPEVINSTACDVAMESKQYYAGEGMVQIVTSVPSLTRFKEFCKFKRDFWIKRNNAMVDNIVSWIKQFRGKTVLVLCGYEHRYFLRMGLKKQAGSETIILKDYWSF
jgi:hypothetical protein